MCVLPFLQCLVFLRARRVSEGRGGPRLRWRPALTLQALNFASHFSQKRECMQEEFQAELFQAAGHVRVCHTHFELL